jgi:hypothetical protein
VVAVDFFFLLKPGLDRFLPPGEVFLTTFLAGLVDLFPLGSCDLLLSFFLLPLAVVGNM